MTEVLKKPIHLAILKSTHIQKLAEKGVIKQSQFGVNPDAKLSPLPGPEKETKQKMTALPSGSNMLTQARKQVRLTVLHESVPPLPADKKPPCDSCKTAACCTAFIVELTQLEYESGIYGDAAVKITPEMYEQLGSRFIAATKLVAPRVEDKTRYILEGMVGEPCPFLTDDKKCSIYDIRPVVCRTYSCVGDERITEGMRQGTEPIGLISLVKGAK